MGTETVIITSEFDDDHDHDGDEHDGDHDDGDEHGKEERLDLNENHLRRRMTMRWQPRM